MLGKESWLEVKREPKARVGYSEAIVTSTLLQEIHSIHLVPGVQEYLLGVRGETDLGFRSIRNILDAGRDAERFRGIGVVSLR